MAELRGGRVHHANLNDHSFAEHTLEGAPVIGRGLFPGSPLRPGVRAPRR